MDGIEVRLELVKQEMSELQQGIRAHDSLVVQIKGWAVTVGVAAAGLALTAGEPLAAVLGAYAAITFWVLEAHRRGIQYRMINRLLVIEKALLEGLATELGRSLEVPYLAHSLTDTNSTASRRTMLMMASRGGTWALYVALIVLMVAVAIASA